jgi:hypothetical protein
MVVTRSENEWVKWTSRFTLSQFGQITATNMVVCLQENLSQTGLSDRVVFEIELVEAVEGILVGMHIQGVD